MATLEPKASTASILKASNPVLANNEIIFEVPDEGNKDGGIKMGDGTSSYNDLPYLASNNKINVVESTLTVANWSNGTYSFESQYPTSRYIVQISISKTASEAAFKAWADGNFCSNVDANVLRVGNGGVRPTVNIPVVLVVTEI